MPTESDGRGGTYVAVRQWPRPEETRLSKADQIHGALKWEITCGELLPGTVIDKTELCRRFSVSRLPVTTALHRLAFEVLVLSSLNGLLRLAHPLRRHFAMDIARRAIEAEVAAEAARRLPAEAREELARNLRYQEAAVDGTDFDGFIRLDVAFHHLLTEGVELNRIAETLDALRVHPDRVRRLLLPEVGRMAATLAEHRTIGEAIASSKPSAAGRAMRRHLAVVMDRLIAFKREHPEFFGS